MKHLKSKRFVGFKHNAIHRKKEPHAVFYLKQRISFWIAVFSVFAFLVGNMMGQHGWHGFWASVLGEQSLVAYTGTASPLPQVVDYGCWARYGGDFKIHKFSQSPKECRIGLPSYMPGQIQDGDLISMQYMSSYKKQLEGTGNHVGVDIRVPVGTPTHAIMNGTVVSIGNQPSGFGVYVVVEHPDVPDPRNPEKATTLYSSYSHLSAVLVAEGDIVHRGEKIALSGETGYSTGPHLDFQIARENAPFLPYFPNSQSEGYAYTVSPLSYIQANYEPVHSDDVLDTVRQIVMSDRNVVEQARKKEPVVAKVVDKEVSRKLMVARLHTRREARIRQRLARLEQQERLALSLRTGVSRASAPETSKPVVVLEKTIAADRFVLAEGEQRIHKVQFRHDGTFSGRGWEKVELTLLGMDGQPVFNPKLDKDLVLRTTYGKAEFRPPTLSTLDFVEGKTTIFVLPRGRQTVVLRAMPLEGMSAPMQYVRTR